MKTIYRILLMILSVATLAWFMPWLMDVVFPVATKDPFVAYSPISNSFIVSYNDGDNTEIFAVDSCGDTILTGIGKNDRDSLLPQVYFNQLNARGVLPDTIAGLEISIPVLKQNQWTFSSLPRDINRVDPGVYFIMESMPPRFELEDPTELFRLDGCIEFIEMATNEVDRRRSDKFNKVFIDRGFVFPARSLSANITARKQYDEGYLMADANGDLYHMKMMGGNPFMVKVAKPDSISIGHVFIMENVETRHLGLAVDSADRLYVLEKADYSLHRLPIDSFDPTTERISIYKTLFNWVVKIRSEAGSRWFAIDSDDYSLLGRFDTTYGKTATERFAARIFPFQLSFTSIDDQFAKPRFTDFSGKSLPLNAALALIVTFIAVRRRASKREIVGMALLTIPFGIYLTISYLIIKSILR